jgi:hypothetical protein
MPKRTSFLRLLTERGPLIVLAVAGVMLFGVAGPASAQFFDFGFGRRPSPPPPRGGPGGGGGGFFSPFSDTFGPGQQQQAPRVDYSRAPAAAKRDTIPEQTVLVLGDAMADWLAYGLEDALAETPELGVIRKHKTVSGLLKYQPKGEPSDWVAAAKGILATEKPDVIVVMLGLNDRSPIREPAVEKKTDAKPGEKPGDKAKGAKKGAKPNEADAAKPGDKPAEAGTESKTADNKPADAKPAETEVAPDDDDDTPQIMAPEKARSASGSYDFREERWVELYTKKIEDMVAVLKSKGVPVLWVGLPAIRGPKATSDMLFLDALYRDVAGKTGITYVDVWDGFVDEAGRFAQQGPDFEGQTRRLRSNDGVYFTKAGARKLAHYTEREIRRVLATRSGPIALPSESFSPDSNIRPGEAGPRPLMGPVIPLVASSVGTDELLGGVGTRPASVDALAARTLVKGEPLAPPAGRADDFSWPRREVGALSAPPSDPAVAAVSPDGGVAAARPKPRRPQTAEGHLAQDTSRVPPGFTVRQQRPAGRDTGPRPPPSGGFPSFGFGGLFGRW